MRLPSPLFKPGLKKIKKFTPKKIPYISRNGAFNSKIKKFLIFSQKKAFFQISRTLQFFNPGLKKIEKNTPLK